MFDWVTFLDLADALLAPPTPSDAAARTAISRAYYAVFRAARRHLDPTGSVIPPDGRAHKRVWDAFQTVPSGIQRRIAQEGRRLKRRRDRADYDDVYPDLVAEARESIIRARRLVGDIASLS